MTYTEQKRVEALRAKVTEAYNQLGKGTTAEKFRASKLWNSANEKLDKYLDGVYARETKRANKGL